MSNYQWIIITGNPVDGFKYYGPYDDYDDALKTAEIGPLDGDWWITKIWLNIGEAE